MKIVLLGATGFVGSALLNEALDRGHIVVLSSSKSIGEMLRPIGARRDDHSSAARWAYVVAVNANRSAEYVHYDHCIIRTRSFHIEERNRTIQ